jgi:hypothetical protein
MVVLRTSRFNFFPPLGRSSLIAVLSALGAPLCAQEVELAVAPAWVTAFGGAGLGFEAVGAAVLPSRWLGLSHLLQVRLVHGWLSIAVDPPTADRRWLTTSGITWQSRLGRPQARLAPFAEIGIFGVRSWIPDRVGPARTSGDLSRAENSVGGEWGLGFGGSVGSLVRVSPAVAVDLAATILHQQLYNGNRSPIVALRCGLRLSSGSTEQKS